MILKKCDLDDLEELAAIGRETYFETFHSMNSPETMSRYLDEAFNPEKLELDLRNESSHFYFLDVESETAAYLKVNFAPAQSDINDPDSIEIERIYVKKEFGSRGIGKFLIQHSIELGRKEGCTYAWLGVWEKNTPAIVFYKKMGFVVFGGHSFQMGDELQSDLILKKDI